MGKQATAALHSTGMTWRLTGSIRCRAAGDGHFSLIHGRVILRLTPRAASVVAKRTMHGCMQIACLGCSGKSSKSKKRQQ
eukprot:scaffold255153_cov17-Tisochrysis_lutea.AAC.1